MYAVVRTGGKQYTVKPGDLIRVEKLDKKLGEKFDLTDILFVGGDTATLGDPTVKGAKVSVQVTQLDKGSKITTIKRKRRKGYRRTIGHRQFFTELFVQSISAGGKSADAETKAHIIDPEKSRIRKEAVAAERKENAPAKDSEGAVEKVAKAKTKKVTKKAKSSKASGKSKKSGTKKKTSKTKAK